MVLIYFDSRCMGYKEVDHAARFLHGRILQVSTLHAIEREQIERAPAELSINN